MKPKRLLKNIRVQFISLVDRPANKKRIIAKSEDFDENNATFSKTVKIEKIDEEKRVVYGIVYAPNEIDAHGDTTTQEEIEKALERFMLEGRTKYVDKNHDYTPDEGFVRESWIVKEGDPLFDEVGAWAVGIKVTNDETWQQIKKGELTGLSFAGWAEVEPFPTTFVTKIEKSGKRFWHNALPIGEFYHPEYGKVQITKELVEKLAENFKKGYPHYKPPVNISHVDIQGKFGDIVNVEAKEDGLWIEIELTELGEKLLEQERFEYLSLEFAENYEDKETGEKVGPVVLGVALTNRPAHPGVKPLSFSERMRNFFGKMAEMFRKEVNELEEPAEFDEMLIELEEELGEEVIELSLTKEDKEEFLRRIRRESTPQLLEAHKWLHAYAASGKLPTGTTKQDLIWMHNAIVKELNRRKKAKGQKVEPHPTPLKFEQNLVEVELEDDNEVFQFCLGPTLRKLKARAKKKKKKKLSEEGETVNMMKEVEKMVSEKTDEAVKKALENMEEKIKELEKSLLEKVEKLEKSDEVGKLKDEIKKLFEDVSLLKNTIISKSQEQEKSKKESIFKGIL